MKFLYIIIALLILLLMITIHEFGHYSVGKILGFKIDEFSIGFGPKLFSHRKKNGELFSIRLLPLGGYCAFAGESEEEKVLAPEKLKKEEPFDLGEKDGKSNISGENGTDNSASGMDNSASGANNSGNGENGANNSADGANNSADGANNSGNGENGTDISNGTSENSSSGNSSSGNSVSSIGSDGTNGSVEAQKSSEGNTQNSGTQNGVQTVNAQSDNQNSTTQSGENAVVQSENAQRGEENAVVQAENAQNGEEKVKLFNDQPPWKRILVLMAGGVFNLLSAVIFTFIFIAVAGGGTPNVVKVYNPISPSAQTTLIEGDKIISVDGVKIDFYHTLNKALEGKKEGDELNIVVLRDGKEVSLVTVIRKYDPGTEVQDGVYPVGMGVGLNYDKASIGDAFKYSVPYTAELSWLILGTFGDLLVGKVPLSQVSGPIGTVNQMADLGMENWAYFLLLLPLIAANLGIFNLFPIPALDGSKVIFTIVEWIRGKPINQKVESTIHFVGLIVLFGFVVILDIVNLIVGAL